MSPKIFKSLLFTVLLLVQPTLSKLQSPEYHAFRELSQDVALLTKYRR